jgi:hypothetical protein
LTPELALQITIVLSPLLVAAGMMAWGAMGKREIRNTTEDWR